MSAYDDALAYYQSHFLNGDNGDKNAYGNNWMPSNNGSTLSRVSSDQSLAAPWGNGYSVFDVMSPDGSIKPQVEAVSSDKAFDNWSHLTQAFIAAVTGGAASGALGEGATGAGATGIGDAAATGAGSWVDGVPGEVASWTPDVTSGAMNALDNIPGLSTTAGAAGTGANWASDLSGEVANCGDQLAKQIIGNELTNTLNLPINTLPAATSLVDKLKSAITPSNIAKVATALKGAGGSQGGGGPSMGLTFGGTSLVPYQGANETPGMIAAQAVPQQQTQQIAQALLLGDQPPKFSQLQFNPYKLAQALQDQDA